MGFKKQGISVTPPKKIILDNPKIGEEKDNLIWDGETWVTKEEWQKRKKSNG